MQRALPVCLTTLGICLTLVPTAAAQAPPGFNLEPNFPVEWTIPNKDGGLFVNMDADPELEYVAAAQSRVFALNPDGTDVPGWPAVLGDGTFGCPALGDIDGDGEDEIIAQTFFFGISTNLFALNKDGTPVPGFPVTIGGTFRAPSLANIDADPELEILTAGNSGGLGTVYAINGNGSDVPGWPITYDPNSLFDPNFNTAIHSGQTPAVGDVDNDGGREIFVASFFQLFAFDPNGSVLPGFPWNPPDRTHGFNSYSSPSLADMDGDGDLEIITTTSIRNQNPGGFNSAPQIHILNHDGTPLAGWPQDLPTPQINPNGGATSINTPVSIADINNDGILDVVVADVTLCPDLCNVLMAWSADGTPLPGFPVDDLPANQVQIMIADVDNDSFPELFLDNNLAANPPLVFNHDGTPVAGWGLPFLDGSGQPDFGDFNGDGFMDFVMPVNNPVTGIERVRFYLYSSQSIPWDATRAPVATYQYNYRRDGLVPTFGSTCAEDISGDGQIDLSDLARVLAAFGACTADVEYDADADVNSSGCIDLSDLAAILARFGEGC